jgi:polysaccharide biosynthesis protein PslH
MRILAISTWFPYPPNNGSKARAFHLLSRLGRSHVLDLLVLSQSAEDMRHLDDVRGFCRRLAVFPEPVFDPGLASSWRGFFSATPRYFIEHHSDEMDALAARWAAEERYDAVVAGSLGAAPYAAALDVPCKVLDQHNVESAVIARRRDNERSAPARLRYAPTCIKAARFEARLASRFDLVTVVSELDRDQMKRLLGGDDTPEIAVVPNGADPGLLGYAVPPKQHASLIFTGALTYQPNHDAVKCLCREILPELLMRFPDATLRVTGRTDGADLSEFAHTHEVRFTGYLDDIRHEVASACALVAPFRYGGGTRLKLLEAMALGTPVVTTPMGAEGLDARDGVHILLGDSSSELVDRTSSLLADPSYAAEIAENARALVRERYLWSDIADDFERAVARSAGEEVIFDAA